MITSDREMILYRTGRYLKDGSDFLDAAVFEIMKDNRSFFLLGDGIQGLVQSLIPEA